MLGYFNVDEMLDSAPSKMLTEWRAFWNLNPQGQWRSDLRSGIVASVIANVNRDSKRKPEPFTAKDFMPDFMSRTETLEDKNERIKKKLLAFATAIKAKVVKRKKK